MIGGRAKLGIPSRFVPANSWSVMESMYTGNSGLSFCSLRRSPSRWHRALCRAHGLNLDRRRLPTQAGGGCGIRSTDCQTPDGVQRSHRRLPRLCPPGDRILPLHEHSGALLPGLSWQHRRPSVLCPYGLRRLVRGLSRRPAGTPSIPATSFPASAASATDAMPPTCRLSLMARCLLGGGSICAFAGQPNRSSSDSLTVLEGV
jgi:hypothetical protein